MKHALLTLCLLLATSAAAEGKQIAITIDDLPVISATPLTLAEKQAVTAQLLNAIKKHGVRAVGFVNEDKLLERNQLDANVALLEAWLANDMELANHTFGHLGMHKSSVEQMKTAVLKGETISRWLSERAGKPYRYFRHPFTQTGNSVEEQHAFESFLAEHGYSVAPYTIEHNDYLFSCLNDHLLAGKDIGVTRQTVLKEYLLHLDNAVEAFETMSQELFGRQIPQVFLIHANRLNGEMLDATLQRLKDHGYRFIPYDKALEDPAYVIKAGPSKKFGPSWLMRWAKTMNKKLSVYGQPDPAEPLMKAFNMYCQ